MESTTPKPFVFVLMPFSSEFDDVYQLGIRPACESAGTYSERVDEQIYEGGMMQRIYNQIAKADVIVSDMTGRNPNVFYETGYAHALGKRVIMLTQDSADIPFDLKDYPHIVYEGKIVNLKGDLETRVRWHVENPRQELASDPATLEFYLLGKKLSGGGNVHLGVPVEADPNFQVSLSFDIHNPSNRVYDASTLELGVILPAEFQGNSQQLVLIDETRCMNLIREIGVIPPGGWRPIHAEFKVADVISLTGKKFDCAVRIFSPVGFTDIDFSLHIVSEPES